MSKKSPTPSSAQSPQATEEAPKESAAPPSPRNKVEAVLTAFTEVRIKQDAAEQALRASIEEDTVFTDSELAKLLWYAVEVDALSVFRTLLSRHAVQITAAPLILDIRHLRHRPRFFLFAHAIADELRGNTKTVQDLVNELPDAIALRCGDIEQVRAFERVVRALGGRFNRLTFGPIIVKYASPQFVHGWLRTNRIPAGVRQFSARMTALYLNDETDAESLLKFVETLEPELETVEEIIRTLLARRQLGDALVVAQKSPDRYKPALHRILMGRMPNEFEMAANNGGCVQEDEEIALTLQENLLGPNRRALSCGCILFVICTFPGTGWWYVPDELHSLNCTFHSDEAVMLANPWQQYTTESVIGWIDPHAINSGTGTGNINRGAFATAWKALREFPGAAFILSKSKSGTYVIAEDGFTYLAKDG